MERLLLVGAVTGLVMHVGIAAQTQDVSAAASAKADWMSVGNDPGGMKYSPLADITPANVTRLVQAWSYQPGGAMPIVVDNTMYLVSAGNALALRADTGAEIWKFPLSKATPGQSVRRGMTYWPGDTTHAISALDAGLKRPVNSQGVHATRCRTFHAKLNDGAVAYLSKPVDDETLIRHLKVALGPDFIGS